MESIKEKIAYLRGVLDGDSSITDERTKFIWDKMLSLLDDISDDLDSVTRTQVELEGYVEEIDADLADLEDDYYFEYEDDDDIEDFDHEEPEFVIEMECPECHEQVAFDEEYLYDEAVQMTCPKCNAIVFDSRDFDEVEEIELDEDDD